MPADFVDELDDLGFFNYATPVRAESMREDIRISGWTGVFGQSGRLFVADAEDLCEGGVVRFLEDLSPFLAHQGVTLNNLSDSFGETSYSVNVNSVDHVIWTSEDAARAETEPGFLWGAATVRSFALVNKLLADAGAHERLYAINGGNDLMGLVLSEELLALVNGHPDAEPESRAYVPRLVYPWFGQAHE